MRWYLSTAATLAELNRAQNTWFLPEHLEPDLRAGWKLAVHLHNHAYGLGEGSGGVCGGVSPGLSDVGLYRDFAREYRLSAAHITNGFHTGEVVAEKFGTFRTHRD